MDIRIGNGYDVHRFADERDLIIGGVKIEHPQGLLGHSDADVLIHAIIDSLLGASSFEDIGRHFPDTDTIYQNANSVNLLQTVYKKIVNSGISIINIDSVIICESPKISPYIEKMKNRISEALGGLELNRIGIKGKTNEKMGFAGRGEGIAVYSVALVDVTGRKLDL
jgi:2-C-methyl-D-erythritol 2,4-cyclodiphosphate synthase